MRSTRRPDQVLPPAARAGPVGSCGRLVARTTRHPARSFLRRARACLGLPLAGAANDLRPSMQRGGAELVKRSREPEPDPRMLEETGSDSPGTSPAVEGPPLARWTRKQEVGMPQPYELFHRNRTTSCESVGQEVVTAQPYELSHEDRTTSCRPVEQGVDTAQPYELFHGNRTTSCKTGGLPKCSYKYHGLISSSTGTE